MALYGTWINERTGEVYKLNRVFNDDDWLELEYLAENDKSYKDVVPIAKLEHNFYGINSKKLGPIRIELVDENSIAINRAMFTRKAEENL
jgi:hypothetical protein